MAVKTDPSRDIIRNTVRHTALGVAATLAVLFGTAHAQDDRNWELIGPETFELSSTSDTADQESVGAVNGLAPHPTNADRLAIASVNGGVWITDNARAAQPVWRFASEGIPTLSMGAVAYSDDGETLYAGAGRYSSYARRGAETLGGVFQSTDGGVTWTNIDNGVLTDESINRIVPTDDFILVAVNNRWRDSSADQGLFIGQEAGGTWSWTQISNRLSTDGVNRLLPRGLAYDVARDPSDPNTFYVLTRSGVYSADLSGASPEDTQWTQVSNAAINTIASTANHGRLAVGRGGEIWVALNSPAVGETPGNTLAGFFFSDDGGSSWASLDDPITNTLAQWFLSLVADPTNGDLAYVGGGGRESLFRIDASAASGSQASTITGSGTSDGSIVHADSRFMAFDAAGNLLEADDGGVFRRSAPRASSGSWSSVNGNLSISEIYSIAWDRVGNVAVGGFQDNGTNVQSDFARNRWSHIKGGDGGDVAIDDITSTLRSERFLSYQNLDAFEQQTYDRNGVKIASTSPALIEAGGCQGNPDLCDNLDAPFLTPTAVNRTEGNRLLIAGTGHLFESRDQGQTIVGIWPITVNRDSRMYFGIGGEPETIVVASGDNVFIRPPNGAFGRGLLERDPNGRRANAVRGLAVDPDDHERIFTAHSDGRLYMSEDFGVSWTEITGNFTRATMGTPRSAIYATSNADGSFVVGTDQGVFVARGDESSVMDADGNPVMFTNWKPLGRGMPPVPVYDLDFDENTDLLLASTLGRSAWVLNMKERDPIDVVLVMDKSGSMGDPACAGCEAKMTVLKDAAQIFVHTWQALSDADDRIGAVYFDSTVDAFAAPGGETLPSLATQGDAVVNYIRSGNDGGFTAMGGGLQLGINILSTDDRRERSIVLFTDGLQNRDPMVTDDSGDLSIANTGEPSSGVIITGPTALDAGLDMNVSTIGVGVTDDVATLLGQIASETGGLNQLTTNAGADLRRFFIEQLVDALRGSSPQLIDYRYPTTDRSGRGRETFAVNAGASKVVFVTSWDRRDTTTARVRIFKDGVDVTSAAESVERTPFSQVIAFDTSSATPLSSDGQWRVELNAASRMDYEVAALADDSNINYRFGAFPRVARTGGDAMLEAQLFYQGLPRADLADASVVVQRPRASLATLLAETPTPPGVRSMPRHPGETFAEAKLRYLLANDPDFKRRLRPITQRLNLPATGSGHFSTTLEDLRVAGSYQLAFLLEGDTELTGAFERRERRVLLVEPGPFEEGSSSLAEVVDPAGRPALLLRPVDIYGNHLGAGRGQDITATFVGTGRAANVTDRGDGSYLIPLDPGETNPRVAIAVGGDVIADGPVSSITTPGRPGRRPPAPAPAARQFYISVFAGKNRMFDDDVQLPNFVGGSPAARFEADPEAVYGAAFGTKVANLWGGTLRAEGEIAYRTGIIDPRALRYPPDGEREMLTVMANAVFDFSPVYGLTPFVGVGAGLAYNQAEQPLFDNSAVPRATRIFEDDTTNAAWQLFGGVSYPITSQIDVFAQGRYVNGGGLSIGEAGDRLSGIDFQAASAEFGLRIAF
ncbi:MAG: VWA domain-containing protein [Pseudomonadota bacterium]